MRSWVCLQNLYAGAGCLIFSCYLVYDTQLILGGNHKKYQFGLDDYVFAALNICGCRTHRLESRSAVALLCAMFPCAPQIWTSSTCFYTFWSS